MSVCRSPVTAVLTLSLMSCALIQGSAWVYVDNGSASPIEVSVDGGKPVVAPAKGVAVIRLRAGTHRFLVRRGGDVVYDQSRDFPDSPTVAKYVLNPDSGNRYVSKRVKYERRRAFGSPLPLLPEQALDQTVVLKPDPWVAGAFDHVLSEVPPAQVEARQGEEPRSLLRLCRIAAADYDLVSGAKAAAAAVPRATHMSAEATYALDRVLGACP